ncbi:MAG: superoxide dismutase [Candidatus Paceibacterota bacterium]
MEKENKLYKLPDLSYGYKDLEPYMSEEQLKIHHQKHHQAYVNGINKILEDIGNADLNKLAFQIGGHKLHTLFWGNLSPNGGGEPKEKLVEYIRKDFGSFDNFKDQFSKAAMSVEGSGWAALVHDKETDILLIMQIEKHNVNIYPTLDILLVLDMFEHAYYIDYKNEKAKYVDAFWSLVNWGEVNKRLE